MSAELRDDDEPQFERVCAESEIVAGTLRAVTLSDGTRACIGKHDGQLFAVNDRCPHQKFPLSDGELTSDGAVVCSWHGAAFDCRTGRALRGPIRDRGTREAAFGRVATFDIRVLNGDVQVRPPRMSF